MIRRESIPPAGGCRPSTRSRGASASAGPSSARPSRPSRRSASSSRAPDRSAVLPLRPDRPLRPDQSAIRTDEERAELYELRCLLEPGDPAARRPAGDARRPRAAWSGSCPRRWRRGRDGIREGLARDVRFPRGALAHRGQPLRPQLPRPCLLRFFADLERTRPPPHRAPYAQGQRPAPRHRPRPPGRATSSRAQRELARNLETFSPNGRIA
jgi:hypothetical protein